VGLPHTPAPRSRGPCTPLRFVAMLGVGVPRKQRCTRTQRASNTRISALWLPRCGTATYSRLCSGTNSADEPVAALILEDVDEAVAALLPCRC